MATTYTPSNITTSVFNFRQGETCRVTFQMKLEVTVRKSTSYTALVKMDVSPGATDSAPWVYLFNSFGNRIHSAAHDHIRKAAVKAVAEFTGLNLEYGVKLDQEQAQALYAMAALYPED